jgi:hypothetical protein
MSYYLCKFYQVILIYVGLPWTKWSGCRFASSKLCRLLFRCRALLLVGLLCSIAAALLLHHTCHCFFAVLLDCAAALRQLDAAPFLMCCRAACRDAAAVPWCWCAVVMASCCALFALRHYIAAAYRCCCIEALCCTLFSCCCAAATLRRVYSRVSGGGGILICQFDSVS